MKEDRISDLSCHDRFDVAIDSNSRIGLSGNKMLTKGHYRVIRGGIEEDDGLSWRGKEGKP